MNAVAIASLISGAGVVLSVVISVFAAGARWGNIESKVTLMSDRMAKIEGMFTLTLRQSDDRKLSCRSGSEVNIIITRDENIR